MWDTQHELLEGILGASANDPQHAGFVRSLANRCELNAIAVIQQWVVAGSNAIWGSRLARTRIDSINDRDIR
jgi:hypothetical protein